jgi:leucyl aminopeptidase
MQFQVMKAGAARQKTACAVVGIHENAAMSAAARTVDRASGGAIARVLRRGDFAGKSAETFPIVGLRRGPAERILLVGLGPKASYGRKAYRRAVFAATQWLAKTGAANAVSWLAADPVPGIDAYYAARHAVESTNNALYRIPDLKTARKPPKPKLARLGIVVADADAAAAVLGLR